MKIKRLYYFLFFLFISCLSCQKNKPSNQTEHKTNHVVNEFSKHYLVVDSVDTVFAVNAPSKITRKIRSDNHGNILIAAFDKVVIYDGKGFSVLPKNEAFENLEAFDALQDSQGNIWIASTTHGLFRYDGQIFTQFTQKEGLASNRTMHLYEDKTGGIWIATLNGIGLYNQQGFKNFTTQDRVSNNDVNTIMEDKIGRIWIGTRKSLCVYDTLSSSFVEFTNYLGNSFTNVWSIVEDTKNNIWIAGVCGLWRYDGKETIQFSQDFITSVFEDNDGNIWTTSTNGALSYYPQKNHSTNKEPSIKVFQAKSMFFWVYGDKHDNIWIGALNGIYRYDGKAVTYFKEK